MAEIYTFFYWRGKTARENVLCLSRNLMDSRFKTDFDLYTPACYHSGDVWFCHNVKKNA